MGRVRLLPADPFATVEADLALTGAGAVALEWVSPDGARRVLVTADRRRARLDARLEVDGAVLARLDEVEVDLVGGLSVVAQLQGRSVLVWTRPAAGEAATRWVGRLELAPHLDLRGAGARRGWTVGLLVEGGPGTVAHCTRFTATRSGNGHADPRLVAYEDGTPVQEGSTVWFLATTRGSLIEDAYQGVYALDTGTGAVTMTGALFGERDGDGVWRNDDAGVLLRDRASGRWSWTATGHSDHPGPRRVWTGTSAADLRHGTHLVPTEPVHLPTGAHWEDLHPVRGADGWVAVASKDARRTAWLVSESGLAGPWRETRGSVGTDETGPLLLDVDGRRFVVAGTGTDAFVVRDADDPAMPAVGHLRLDRAPGGRRVWPALFRVEEEHGPRWHLLTFDRSTPAGPYSYGALHLYRQA